ncbi:hypothetical protein ABZ372_36880 [Streptomyces sp. NPDC005921]
MDGIPGPDEFRAEARSWLKGVAPACPAHEEWGSGDDSVAVFENWTEAEERARTDRTRDWERTRHDQGWGALAWPPEYGGRELPAHYEQLYRSEESAFDVPRRTEIFPVTQQLVAPAVRVWAPRSSGGAGCGPPRTRPARARSTSPRTSPARCSPTPPVRRTGCGPGGAGGP